MRGPARDLHENMGRIGEHAAPIHQRILQRLRERVMRAIIGIRFTEAEQAAAARTAQSGEQIVETDPDQAGTLDQVHDRAHALADRDIGHRERLMNSRFRRDHVAHAIVFETDDGVGIFAQSGERFLRLGHAAFAFESERQGRENHDERARFARDLRHRRRGAGTRPAAQAGANKNHSRVRERLPDFVRGFVGGIVAELRIAARRRVRA